MDSFEFNKLIGALLGTVFVVFSIGLVSDAIFAAPHPEQPGYAIVAAEPEVGDAGGGETAAAESVIPLLASADSAAGAVVFKKCAACHTDDTSGGNKIGPNLWGVVNRPVASHEGFAYSAAMKAHAETNKTWTYEDLDHFLLSPKGFVKGTAMGFAGLKKVEDRASVIAYLRTQADSQEPLPDAAAAAPADDAAKPADAPAPADAAPAPADAAPAPADAAPADATPADAAPAPADAAPADASPAPAPADAAPAPAPAP